jgi:hypothetical protein
MLSGLTNMRSIILLSLTVGLAGSCLAGESIVLSTQYVYNSSIPAQATNGPCRAEWSIHGWGAPPVDFHPASLDSCDFIVYWSFGGAAPALSIYSGHETGGTGACFIPLSGVDFATIRYQRVPTSASTGSDLCQAWDKNGNMFITSSIAYTSILPGSSARGMLLGNTATAVDTAYLREYSTLVPANAAPPTTAQSLAGCLVSWKFDSANNIGSLADSCAGYNATISSGSPVYVNTPYQGSPYSPIAIAMTCGAPSWTLWLSFPVGGTGCLDGSTSFSQADASPAVACRWSNVSGVATPLINAPSNCTSNITAISTFGGYTFGLLATDSAGNTATVNLELGAVSMNSEGIVQPSDPNVNKIFNGPLIAFGRNPWQYEDERNLAAVNLQIVGNKYYSGQAAVWSVPGQGTVSYPFAGIGPGPGQTGASLSGGISATATSITVSNAQNLPGLLTLPTCPNISGTLVGILIGNGIGAQELVRVACTTATTGTATLTVAYDGRGIASTPWGNAGVVPAQAWTAGTTVGEMHLTGTGTLFVSDPNRPLCPAGAPGPMGPIVYNTGHVQMTPNSTAITGIGTSWAGLWAADHPYPMGSQVVDANGNLQQVTTAGTSSPNQYPLWSSTVGGTTTDAGVTWTNEGSSAYSSIESTYMILVFATHAGGTPFHWWAQISTVGGLTSITASRNAPSDIDAGANFSYAILGPRWLSLEFHSWGGVQRLLQNGMYCESETSAFAVAAHDIPPLDQTFQSGSFSYKTTIGCCSAFGPNFYGTGLAMREFYYRSGYTPALTAANQIDDYWIRDPEVASGYGVGETLLYGGGYQGGFADLMLNPSTPLAWSDVRQFAKNGINLFTEYSGCNNTGGADIRDQSYNQLFLTNAAIYDPNAAYQATWLAALGSAGGGSGTLGRDTVCRRADYSFAVPVMTLAGTNVLNLTNGSTTATGTGLDHIGASGGNVCSGVASGTITVAHGSTAATLVTGSLGNPATNFNIVIWDTTSSPNYVGFLELVFSGNAVQLGGIWPGASGTFSFVVQSSTQGLGGNTGGITAIGSGDFTDTDNIRQTEGWACTMVSPTQITLNRPWNDAVTGGAIHPSGAYTVYPAANYGVGPAGYYTQPFMYGIKTYVVSRAANFAPNATVSNGYKAFLGPMGNWFHNVGFDTNTAGTYYARVQGTCEPFVTANTSTLFNTIHGGFGTEPCDLGGLLGDQPGAPANEFPSRVDTVEAFAAVIEYYKSQCILGVPQCNAARAFGDLAYGAIYGSPSMTAPGFYSDTHYVNNAGELSNGALGAYKWIGFFFGMGGMSSNTWPAIRLGPAYAGSSLNGALNGNLR